MPGFAAKIGRVPARSLNLFNGLWAYKARWMASPAIRGKVGWAQLFTIASAIIERAELPVQTNITLYCGIAVIPSLTPVRLHSA